MHSITHTQFKNLLYRIVRVAAWWSLVAESAQLSVAETISVACWTWRTASLLFLCSSECQRPTGSAQLSIDACTHQPNAALRKIIHKNKIMSDGVVCVYLSVCWVFHIFSTLTLVVFREAWVSVSSRFLLASKVLDTFIPKPAMRLCISFLHEGIKDKNKTPLKPITVSSTVYKNAYKKCCQVGQIRS